MPMTLILDLASGNEIEIGILNAEGRLIRSIIIPASNGERNYKEIDITKLPVGVYLIHITQNGFKEVKKLIVVK